MQRLFLSSPLPGSDAGQQSLTAFCATCPAPAEIERLLEPLGLRLVWFLAADDTAISQHDLAPLPAQYHYEDDIGTSVVYLAGQDAAFLADDEEEPVTRGRVRYPPHASRFWLVPGGRESVSRQVREALASAFGLSFLDLAALVEPRKRAA